MLPAFLTGSRHTGPLLRPLGPLISPLWLGSFLFSFPVLPWPPSPSSSLIGSSCNSDSAFSSFWCSCVGCVQCLRLEFNLHLMQLLCNFIWAPHLSLPGSKGTFLVQLPWRHISVLQIFVFSNVNFHSKCYISVPRLSPQNLNGLHVGLFVCLLINLSTAKFISRVSPLWYYILDWTALCYHVLCINHWGILSSISALHPLDASRTTLVVTTQTVLTHCQKSPGEKKRKRAHCWKPLVYSPAPRRMGGRCWLLSIYLHPVQILPLEIKLKNWMGEKFRLLVQKLSCLRGDGRNWSWLWTVTSRKFHLWALCLQEPTPLNKDRCMFVYWGLGYALS